jgi:predicted DNA-binding transcriptional regulator AlpA
MNSESITMTLPAAAQRAGISYPHAYNLACQGQFPGAFRLGRAWRVHRAIFEAEIERMAQGGEAHPSSPDDVLTRALDDARQRTRKNGWER